MTTPPTPTVTELIASLGDARNFAEQGLLHNLRKLERKHDALDRQLADDTLPIWRHRQLAHDRLLVWWEAHAIVMAITCFREYGSKPPIDNYEALAAQLDEEAAQRRADSKSKRET